MSDELWATPTSWAWVTLDDVASWSSGGTPKSTEPRYYGGEIPWLIIGDLNDGVVTSSARTITPLGLENSSAKHVQPGAVMIALYGSIGKLGIAGIRCTTNQAIAFTKSISDAVHQRFLFHYLKGVRGRLLDMGKGGTQANISQTVLKAFPICVAPLAEQRRIVAKLEMLLGQVTTCQQRLAKIPALLKRFRQSVLAAACSGRLTADWREENDNIQAADSLIKNAQYQIAAPEGELPELPAKWKWVALGNYARCFRGRFTPRPRNDPRYFNGKHPFIQIGNLPREGGLVDSHVQTLNDEGLAVSRKFPKGTVVIAIVGATIGNTGVLAYDMCVTDSIVGLETGDELGNRYVELFLRHKKDDIRQTSYSSGGQPNINLATLNPYPLALPPLPEQQEIVRRVESLFLLANQIEARLAAAQRQVDALTPSLLARAFAGKLVPQDPADEPAERLLERIKATKH
jgi:type I restriction enzyme S subunit